MTKLSHKEFWIASGNPDKSRELVDFSSRFFPESLLVKAREPVGVIESEPTFEGNAKLKAQALTRELLAEGSASFFVLGDDSGLCVDLLGGAPGVLSARYTAPNPMPEKNVEKILEILKSMSLDPSKRTGCYICALHLIQVTDGKIVAEFTARGEREGILASNPKGRNGYAYDGIFLDPITGLSYAELSYSEKQRDSHRFRAFEKLKKLSEAFYL